MIDQLIEHFEQFVEKNQLIGEPTKALWLFCDETEEGNRILEDKELEKLFRWNLRSKGWNVSDGCLLSSDDFRGNLEDVLRA